jgi:hypothetical protein
MSVIEESLSMERRWNDTDRETEVLREKSVPVLHCPPQFPHIGLELKPGFRGERPTINRRRHGTIPKKD